MHLWKKYICTGSYTFGGSVLALKTLLKNIGIAAVNMFSEAKFYDLSAGTINFSIKTI
jgi:hypothetical protein